MAENDGNGKIEKVGLWETDDGTLFTTQSAATAYEEALINDRKQAEIFNDGKKAMLVNSKSLVSVNPSYAAVSGDFFERGGVYSSLESMIVDTPEETKKLIQSINGRRKI
jgi:hypothetical protein